MRAEITSLEYVIVSPLSWRVRAVIHSVLHLHPLAVVCDVATCKCQMPPVDVYPTVCNRAYSSRLCYALLIFQKPVQRVWQSSTT